MKKKTVKKVAKKTVKKKVAKKVAKKTVKKKVIKKVAKKTAIKLKKDEALVTFQIPADAGSVVYVAGSFNNWDEKANKLIKNNDIYKTSIVLKKGTYEYKFLVNGVWCVDPNCDDWQSNNMGTINSTITVN